MSVEIMMTKPIEVLLGVSALVAGVCAVILAKSMGDTLDSKYGTTPLAQSQEFEANLKARLKDELYTTYLFMCFMGIYLIIIGLYSLYKLLMSPVSKMVLGLPIVGGVVGKVGSAVGSVVKVKRSGRKHHVGKRSKKH